MLNPASGRGRAVRAADRACGEFVRVGLVPVRIALDAPEEDVRSSVAGARAVVVVGGDGTVRSLAARMAGSGVPIAIVPTGTENLAARAFGFRCSARRLAEAVVRGSRRQVDLGEVVVPGRAPHPFVVMASAGFDAEVVARVQAGRTGPISHRTYMGPILRAIRGWRAPWIEVRPVGGGPAPGMTGGIGTGLVARRDAFAGTVVIANAREYALRMNPAHDADPSDGALDGVSLAARTGGAMLAWVARCLLRLPLPPEARRGRAEAWELGFDRPVHLQADGDPVPGGPAREAVVRVRPGATCLLDMRGAGG
jgi:diacylglycerol kinase family enzyme